MGFKKWLDDIFISKGWKHTQEVPPKKLFRIESPKIISIDPEGSEQEPNHFTVHSMTRPNICPICRTENKITRLPSNEWNCEECGHTWQI